MSIQAAFLPMGQSVILTTNAVASTNQSFAVVYSGSANLNIPSALPNQARFINIGTDMIWLNFTTPSVGTAVIPTAGTTTLGTPQPSIWLAPNVEVVLTLPVSVVPLLPAGTGVGFWLNTISASASQKFQMHLGEGL